MTQFGAGDLNMTRLKRNSPSLNKASIRIPGMRSISGTLDFGDGLNLVEYEARYLALQDQLLKHNSILSDLDASTTQVTAMEKELNDYSERMLMCVRTRYGKDSTEYVHAGGTIRKAHKSKRSIANSSATATATPTATATLTTEQMDAIASLQGTHQMAARN
jgi:hypothetical protein